ncbi:class I SAM-dependent methyltransferase [Roseivirga seohaensis]|uniref:class I SAM-dependent methyltransferase n=1 Tax=Roseivirga seohaensis TaxID=1914963 RepID=UPI003BA8C99C
MFKKHTMIDIILESSLKAITDNYFESKIFSGDKNQDQTSGVFSEKWGKTDYARNINKINDFQRKWFYELYGFDNEVAFVEFLSDKKVILDAGCGLGYKAAWIAELAPHATVLGMDFSDSGMAASKFYSDIKNLFFIRGDIADTDIKTGVVDFVLCDQVIMHTENPENTFKHLSGLLTENGVFATYVYAKKALPRELLDDYFREKTHQLSNEQLWEMSAQLTELGKQLSALNIEVDFPEIPLLGIKGGQQNLQRFIYWNFIKCFWNEELGDELSDATNFDWYSPSYAKRFSKDEFLFLITENKLNIDFFHSEEACYSGRFSK